MLATDHSTTKTNREQAVIPLLNAQARNARRFLDRGINVIPVDIQTRRPCLDAWKPYQTQRVTLADLATWSRQFPNATYMGIAGPISGLIDLDLDDPAGLDWCAAQGGLPETFAFVGNPERPGHRWFRYPDGLILRNVDPVPGVEIKAINKLFPLPGSLHKSGKPYRITQNVTIAACPGWLADLLKPVERPTYTPALHPASDDAKRNYALAALDAEAAALAATKDGEKRFRAIYDAAFKLGTLIGAGVLSRGEVEPALLGAARANGYVADHGETTAQTHIRNGLTDGEQCPRDLAHLDDQRAVPSITRHNTSVQTGTTVPVLPATWPRVYPAALERVAFEYYPRAGKQVNKVLRSVVEYVGAEPFTVNALATRSGIPRKTIDRALASLGAIMDRLTCDLSYQEGRDSDQENTIGQSVPNPTGPGPKGNTYRLPAYPAFVERLIEYKIRPTLEQDEAYKPRRITRALARTLDATTTPAQLETANRPIDTALSDAERAQEAERSRRLEAKIAQIRRALSDTSGTPLPDGWQKDYVGKVIEHYAAAHEGVQESKRDTSRALGLSESTIWRTERRTGFYREENTVPETVSDPARLPAQGYNFDKKGAPVQAIITRAGQVVATWDYRHEAAPDRVRSALTVPDTEAVIYYQQAGTIQRMSDEQRAAYEAEREAQKAQRAAAREARQRGADLAAQMGAEPPRPKPAPQAPAYDGVDYAPDVARALVRHALTTYHGYQDTSRGTVEWNGELYAAAPLATLSGPDLMRLARRERLIDPVVRAPDWANSAQSAPAEAKRVPYNELMDETGADEIRRRDDGQACDLKPPTPLTEAQRLALIADEIRRRTAQYYADNPHLKRPPLAQVGD